MAIIIEGKSVCVLCGNVILSAGEAIGFPAFLPRGHRLAPFSDAAFHLSCFAGCQERADVEAAFAKYQAIWQSRPAHLKTLAEIEAWGKEAFRTL